MKKINRFWSTIQRHNTGRRRLIKDAEMFSNAPRKVRRAQARLLHFTREEETSFAQQWAVTKAVTYTN